MKKKIVRLTESQLHKAILTSVKNVLCEMKLTDIDDGDMPEPILVYVNLNTLDCTKSSVKTKSIDGMWMAVHVAPTQMKQGDDGIGDYEYWGQKGYDSRPYTYVSDCDITEIEEWFSVSGGKFDLGDEEDSPSLSQDAAEAVIEYALANEGAAFYD